MRAQRPLQDPDFSKVGYTLRSGVAESHGASDFIS